MINLGCTRNLVDAQIILGNLKRQGWTIADVDHSEVVIINTCAFVEDAKKESIEAIWDLIESKRKGKIKKVIVAGCLTERYGQELLKEFKDIDAIVGVQQLERDHVPEQVLLTANHSAYLKICESCYNACSFCVIPHIKGRFISRRIDSIVEEVRQMDQRGVKELNIIGQDITAYGIDIYKEKSLTRLLREIVSVSPHIPWIRLLYTFPGHVTDDLIEFIAEEEKICNYIDLPLQHINDRILKRMNRNITKDQTLRLIEKIRKKIPRGILRTTLITGFPSETEEEFEELLRFIKEVRFERLGVFAYSREEGTSAYEMKDQIPENIKKQRRDILMSVQQDISRGYQESFIGQKIPVMIDESVNDSKDTYLGRTQHDAPDVDGVVFVHSPKPLPPGDFVSVRIVDAYEYDLVGEVL